MPIGFKDFMVTYDPSRDEYLQYRAQKRRRNIIGGTIGGPVSEQVELDEIQIGWHHKTQKYHTIKHPDGSHYGVYDHSSYGTSGYEIRKIKTKDGQSLRAKDSRKQSGDRYMAGATGGPTAAAKRWVEKHGGTIHNHKVNEDIDSGINEALTPSQRRARGRLFKKYKAKIKLGQERARRKVASPEVLKKRARKAARNLILKKLTKGMSKDELTYARRQEFEKRLETPAMKKKIDALAKKMIPQIRKNEMARKRGSTKND